MNINSKLYINIGGAFFFASTAGYVIYQLFKKDENFIEDHYFGSNIGKIPLSKIKVNIPSSALGVIIGRHGKNIKMIQEMSSTSIKFLDNKCSSNMDEVICEIEGQLENIDEAKKLIARSIEEIPIFETDEVIVPKRAVDLICGHGETTLKSIMKLTGCKIKIRNTVIDDERQIYLKGTAQQIQATKLLIDNKIRDFEVLQEEIKKRRDNILERNYGNATSNNTNVNSLSHNDEHYATMDAYVTAMHTAFHFWIQFCDSDAIALNRLIEKMTEFYSDDSNRKLNKVTNLDADTMVAACFPRDKKWYRGRICEREDYDPIDKVPVYFVDYGDTELIDPKSLCELRTDFLILKYQAVECILAGIDQESLTKKADETFTSLVNVGQGKKVNIEILSYFENSIPCVQVTSTSDNEEKFDVGLALVEEGVAQWEDGRYLPNPQILSLLEPFKDAEGTIGLH